MSGDPDPGPTAATRAAAVRSSSSVTRCEACIPGIGSVGSSAMEPKAPIGTSPIRSIAKSPTDRNGASRRSASAPAPRYAAATNTKDLPRIGSGSSGNGGNW